MMSSQLPLDINDEDLLLGLPKPGPAPGSLTNMSSAIHLFKLARFNSEIKCVLYCVDRLYPPYTQPSITDIDRWKGDMLDRLHHWEAEIPRHPEGSTSLYMNLLCEIKYHELIMLVLRPSPLFHQPSKTSLRECFSSALKCSKLYHTLYNTNMLHYSWISVHSLFLCIITMFYCVWTPDGVTDGVNFDTLMQALKSTSDVLSATGEYWPEAKRSRDVLDRISAAIMKRFTQNFNEIPTERMPSRSQPATEMSSDLGLDQPADMIHLISHNLPPLQFENGDMGNSHFSPSDWAQTDSFTGTDVLSYFMGSRGDMNMGNAEIPGEYYPSVDEAMQDFFGDGLGDFEYDQ